VSQPSRYTVGIDLGTTHCVLARGDPDAGLGEQPVELFEVPQLQAPGEVVSSSLLPSFMYMAGPNEFPEGAVALPWGDSESGIVGDMARRRGSEVPDRLVHSAKSWLCHDGVDRRTPFLPRSPAELPRRVSPVEASAAYLEHLRRAWDHLVARGDPSLTLAAQDLVVTVPASFGEVARQLTAEAAARAGLERVHLVEEPQAAFYSWLARHGADLDEALAGLSLILVVDVGGGTTDLTLIRVTRKGDEPELTRVAVGEHLMLGGDNMDLALAAVVESRLGAGAGRLDGRRWQGLRQSCRVVRETLLQEQGPEVSSVVVSGRGSALVGGQLRVELARQEVLDSMLDDFFPEVGPDAEVHRREGLGLREWGLPYADDTAVTRHIAAFLRRYRAETGDVSPLDGVLLNGGVLNPPLVARRLMDVIGGFSPAGQEPPRLLTTTSLDLAVALGAAYYGLVRRGRGVRIVSGLARAVYVGLELRRKKRKGRKRVRRAALCLAPQGMQEGEHVELTEHQLNLTVGREVLFPLFVASGRGGRPGEVREADDPTLEALPSLRTRLPGSGSRGVPVELRARLTEVGTLDLVAAKTDGSGEYRLEFDLRAQGEGGGGDDEAPTFRELDPDRVERASAMLSELFGPEGPPGSANLVPRMERILKSKRDQWPLPSIRGFFEILRPDKAHRKGPAGLEAAWLNLTGFCLRPGYGYPGDGERLELMQPVLEAGCGAWDNRTRVEWWVLWRRIAGGLNREVQDELFKALVPEMGLAKRREDVGPVSSQELIQIWMLAASLERVPVSAKRDLGEAILRGVEAGKEPRQALWCLGRLGARAPVYGGIDTVVPTDRVEAWSERLLALSKSKREHYSLALTLLARMTGDRSRDIDEGLREKVLERLGREKAQTSWQRMVKEVVADEPIDCRMLGETLPPGLRLLA
jgi:molecular chaperone DnaK (HSP70)